MPKMLASSGCGSNGTLPCSACHVWVLWQSVLPETGVSPALRIERFVLSFFLGKQQAARLGI